MVKNLSLGFIAFLQATGILLYCGLVSTIFVRGEKWFGPQPSIFGPALFLALFATSAVICTLIFLTYPFLLFWEHKQTKTALRLVLYSTLWLVGFIVSGLAIFALT
jgi:uncharacterized membrane protein